MKLLLPCLLLWTCLVRGQPFDAEVRQRNFVSRPAVIVGTGNGNTNYSLSASNLYMFLGGSNVSIVAVTHTLPGFQQQWTATVTNLPDRAWGIRFSSVTNRWRFYNPAYGTNAPSVLSNNTALVLQCESVGTNILVHYRYYKPAL